MYDYRKLTAKQQREVVEGRLARGFPPHGPPHPLKDAGHYLLSAACYEHRPLLEPASRRERLRESLLTGCTACGMELHAWAILPNHYHLLGRIDDLNRFGRELRQVHGALAREWNQEDAALGRKVWFRYSDRAIRSDAHYFTSLNYVHYNPVKHGYTESPYDWPHSSVHWYLEYRGREWLRDLWRRYPMRDYGEGWDG